MNLTKYISNSNFNYTTLFGKKLLVNDDQYEQFFIDYLNSNVRDITEKHLDDKTKLLIDIDLKHESSNRLIKDIDIENIVDTINEFLDVIFVSPNKKCYVFQRPTPYKKDNL